MPLVIAEFMEKHRINAIQWCRACEPEVPPQRFGHWKALKTSPGLKNLETLLMGARKITGDNTVSFHDIIRMPTDTPQMDAKLKDSLKMAIAPITQKHDVDADAPLSEIIQAFIGANGADLVPLMLEMAQGRHTTEQGKTVSVSPAEKKFAMEWLGLHGKIGEAGNVKDTVVLIALHATDGSELGKLTKEDLDEFVEWKEHRQSAPQSEPDEISVGVSEQDSDGGEEADRPGGTPEGGEGPGHIRDDAGDESAPSGDVRSFFARAAAGKKDSLGGDG